jgi:hypothetical protein
MSTEIVWLSNKLRKHTHTLARDRNTCAVHRDINSTHCNYVSLTGRHIDETAHPLLRHAIIATKPTPYNDAY